jgi:hypothetical protein
VLAEEHGRDGEGSVVVVRGRDDDGIEILLGIEESTPVAVRARRGVFLRWSGESAFIDVAEGDDADFRELADFAEVASPLPGDADVSRGELFGRRCLTASGDEVAREEERSRARSEDGLEEVAASGHA